MGGEFKEGAAVAIEALLGPLNNVERKYAPRHVWVGGDASIFAAGTLISVVGSRAASPEGIRRARRLARELVQRGMVVVSGLALGIDTVAHKTAIDCGGRTIAVLATPLERATPPGNSALQRQIIQNHTAVTQFSPGTPIQKMNFALRNRTMALVSAATVVVEADEKSGTRHQGWEAIRLGRPLFFLESAVSPTCAEWIRDLMQYGAAILNDGNLSRALDDVPTRTHGEEFPF